MSRELGIAGCWSENKATVAEGEDERKGRGAWGSGAGAGGVKPRDPSVLRGQTVETGGAEGGQ